MHKPIAQDSLEWTLLLKQLKRSKTLPSNDYLCLICWKIFTISRAKAHRREFPLHVPKILTPLMFAS